MKEVVKQAAAVPSLLGTARDLVYYVRLCIGYKAMIGMDWMHGSGKY